MLTHRSRETTMFMHVSAPRVHPDSEFSTVRAEAVTESVSKFNPVSTAIFLSLFHRSPHARIVCV